MIKKLLQIAKTHPVWVVVAVLIASRLILFGLGTVIYKGIDVNAWVHWDSKYYLQIAGQGYDSSYSSLSPDASLCNQSTGFCQRNFAFFPLYPLTLNIVNQLTGISLPWVGFLLSNLFFVAAGIVLFKLALKLMSERGAWIAILLFAVFPFGYIFSGVMSESLFIFLLLSAFYLAFTRRYLLSAVVGVLLASTRNTGILFAIPLLFLILEQAKIVNIKAAWKFLTNKPKFLAAVLIVPLGLIFFMAFLQARTGDPLAFINIQKYWEKPVLGLNPLFALFFSLVDYRLEGMLSLHFLDLAVLAGVLVLLVISVKKKLFKWSINNILLWLLVPMTAGTLLAFPRYAAVLFPVYLIPAKLLSNRPKLALLVIIMLWLLQLALSYLYIKGSWLTV